MKKRVFPRPQETETPDKKGRKWFQSRGPKATICPEGAGGRLVVEASA